MTSDLTLTSTHTLAAAERKARLGALQAEIRRLYADTARSVWHIGACLLEIQRSELWREGGHTSFATWLVESSQPISAASAWKGMRIAQHFSAEMAARFGSEKLDAAVGYLGATVKDEQPGDLLAVQVRIRGEGGVWTAVPFAEASTGQIREATRALGHKKRVTWAPPEVRAQVAKLNKTLAKAPGLGGAAVGVRRNRAGRVVLSMSGVPVDGLAAFFALAQGHLATTLG